jgi:adenylosuccinate lyase
VALAEVQSEFGLVSSAQVADLRAHMTGVDLPAALEIEAELQHDLMAEIQLFARQCQIGGGIIHLGATSMDIEDNADVMRMRAALDLLLESLANLLRNLSLLIKKWANTPLIAFTHLQPAEPSTLGYRLALYGQDLLQDYQSISMQRNSIKGKGFKGAVGTSAAYAALIGSENLPLFEEKLARKVNLPFYSVASQVYPRKQDYEVISTLAGLGASLYKIAFDLRLLQMPTIGELSEPFGEKQVGSSAMPFKRNPIRSEKINSLARYLASMPRLAWDNAAHSLLERTLDDSANRRILLPESCLAADELLRTMNSIFSKLQIDEEALARNLSTYGLFAATERILMSLVKVGADRQEMHARLCYLSGKAWEAVRLGQENPLVDAICQDNQITDYLPDHEIRALLDPRHHLGDSPKRALDMADRIQENIKLKANDTMVVRF